MFLWSGFDLCSDIPPHFFTLFGCIAMAFGTHDKMGILRRDTLVVSSMYSSIYAHALFGPTLSTKHLALI